MITEVVTGNSRAEIDANVAALQHKHGLDRVPAPQTLETGTLVLLRMAAHSRSPNQQEYFAPAVVLAQYEPNGEIDALVWDASAGNAFVHGYAIRDLGTRDTQQGREQYVIQSNIGQVLFSPQQFERMQQEFEKLFVELRWQERIMRDLLSRLEALEAAATTPVATSDAAPAASMEAKPDPKGQAKRT